MSARSCVSHAVVKHTAARPAPVRQSTLTNWIKQNFFASPFNSVMTLLALWALAVTLPGIIQWVLIDAVWFSDGAAACGAAEGACWAVIPEKYRVMLFGTFPYDEQWRGAVVIGLILALAVASAFKAFSLKGLAIAWGLATVAVFILMLGGVFGLQPIPTHQWGGLPLTLIMFVGTVVGGIPAGVMLALDDGLKCLPFGHCVSASSKSYGACRSLLCSSWRRL